MSKYTFVFALFTFIASHVTAENFVAVDLDNLRDTDESTSIVDNFVEAYKERHGELRYIIVPQQWIDGSRREAENDTRSKETTCFPNPDRHESSVVGLFKNNDSLVKEIITITAHPKIKTVLSYKTLDGLTRGLKFLSPEDLEKLASRIQLTALEEVKLADPLKGNVFNWFLSQENHSHYLLFTGISQGSPSALYAITCTLGDVSSIARIAKQDAQAIHELIEGSNEEPVPVKLRLNISDARHATDTEPSVETELLDKIEFIFTNSSSSWPGEIHKVRDVNGAGFEIIVEAPAEAFDDSEAKIIITTEHPFWLVGAAPYSLGRQMIVDVTSADQCLELLALNRGEERKLLNILTHEINGSRVDFAVSLKKSNKRAKRLGLDDFSAILQDPAVMGKLNRKYFKRVWGVNSISYKTFQQNLRGFIAELQETWNLVGIIRDQSGKMNFKVSIQSFAKPGWRIGRPQGARTMDYVREFWEYKIGEEKLEWPVEEAEIEADGVQQENLVRVHLIPYATDLGARLKEPCAEFDINTD